MQTTLDFLDGHELTVYSATWCPDCTRLARWLENADVRYTEVNIDRDPAAAAKLEAETGKRAVPFILIDGKRWVRGYHREARSRLDGDLLMKELAEAVRG
jgi:glutaredoxin